MFYKGIHTYYITKTQYACANTSANCKIIDRSVKIGDIQLDSSFQQVTQNVIGEQTSENSY